MRKFLQLIILIFICCFSAQAIAADLIDSKSFSWNALYTSDVINGLSGPLKKKMKYVGNILLTLNVDGATLLHIPGNTILISVVNMHAGKPNARVRSAQRFDDIEVVNNTTRVYQAWMQQKFFNDKASVLFGLYDLNTEFYVTDSSSVFIMAPMGMGTDMAQTGVNGPAIYPTPALAGRLKIMPSDHFYWMGAIVNALAGDPLNPTWTHIHYSKSTGALLVTEGGALWGSETARGKIALGLWNYTANTDSLTEVDIHNNPLGRHNRGGYVILDAPVFRFTKNSHRGMNVFIRYGVANQQVNRFAKAAGFGLMFNGLFVSRPNDLLGVAIAPAKTGTPYRLRNAPTALTSETLYELTYVAIINKHVTLQPDLEYVSIKGNPALKSSLLAMLRFKLATDSDDTYSTNTYTHPS